jgi:hypothetical protein
MVGMTPSRNAPDNGSPAALRRMHQVFGLGQDHPRASDGGLAGRGQRGAPRAALHQGGAQNGLQFLDARRQGRLGDEGGFGQL